MWNRQSVSIISSSRFLINRQLCFLIDTSTNLFFAASMVLQRSHICQLMSSLLFLSCYLFWLYLFWQVSQLTLTFKEIVNNYKREPQCKPEVFRSVFVGSTNRNGVCTWLQISSLLFFSPDISFPSFWFHLCSFVLTTFFFLTGTRITPCWYHCFL